MEQYDLIVIGSGAGENVVSNAVSRRFKVALVERGWLGGTCLNNGCIPSKMLIHPADVIRSAQEATAIGVEAALKPDFTFIMNRMRAFVTSERTESAASLETSVNPVLIKGTAEFTGPHTLNVDGREITAPKIVIATGARPLIPPIPGLADAGFLDNVTMLELKTAPKSLIIIGGGYIGCEYGHFFSAMGTDVTIIGRPPVLLNDEDPEVSAVVTESLSRYLKVRAGFEAEKVSVEGGRKIVQAKNMKDGSVSRFEADEILVALGRRSNSDLLKPDRAGVATDKKGWIKVNEYLETSVPGIWALGDATDKYMFRHTANYHSEVVTSNMFDDEKTKVDEHAVPHAVFTWPQVGHVGKTEAEAKTAGIKVSIGRARFSDTAMGIAMADRYGFVKVVAEAETEKILGCSIVGPEAAILVQQVVYLMNAGKGDMEPLYDTQVIHPAMSEVIMRAFGSLEPAE